MSVLTKEDVATIKQQIVEGKKSNTQIALEWGVSRGLISDIANDRRHVDVPWPSNHQSSKPGGQKKQPPQHDPTDARILALEAEVTHLKDEKNHYKRAATAHAKEHGLYQACVEVINEKIVPLKALPSAFKSKRHKNVIQEDLVLHLSDGHHDQIVTLEESGGLERYDFLISCARAERLIETLLEHSQEHLERYEFETLWILANGDHTSGEIHDHEKRSYYRNQMNNSLAIGQLHALMLRDLAPFFKQINCVYVPGNHGRRTTRKNHYGAHENWDYMIGKITELWCRDLKNISFALPNAFSANVVIRGHGFNMTHGDDIKGWSGIPFYGMIRRQKNLMALNSISDGPNIRYFCMGHHHVQASMADLNGELLVNGAWLANDPYSYNSFAGYRAPSQLLHGVHDNWGVTWRLPIDLKHDGERNGPKRYFVEV